MADRPLPASLETERAVLSCILMDPGGTLDQVMGMLKWEECFFLPAHQRIYKALIELRRELGAGKIDIITLGEYLERKGWLEELGGHAAIGALMGLVPTTANLEKYLELVLDAYILRRLITSCGDISARCYEAEEQVPELVDRVEQEILAISQMRISHAVRPIQTVLREAFDYLDGLGKKDSKTIGLATHYADLDRLITGLKPGELFILAARPSIGKTTFALNVAANIAIIGKVPVGIFSLEMNCLQLVLRLICAEARVNLKDIRDGRLPIAEWHQSLIPAMDRLGDAPIFIDDTPQITSVELRQKARRLYTEHHIQFLVVDYLQLMRATGLGKNASREQEVARLSADLKALARELNIPIMLLCQLNRQAEAGSGVGKPRLSHLRESGAIEQDADLVAILHRERETDSQQSREELEQNGIETQLIVAKHRNGETGIVPLLFFNQFTRFESVGRVSDQDVRDVTGGGGG